MTTQAQCTDPEAQAGALGDMPTRRHSSLPACETLPDFELVDPFAVPTISESAEEVIKHLDAPRAAAPALLDGLSAAIPAADDAPPVSGGRAAAAPLVGSARWTPDPRPLAEGTVAALGECEARAISLDEYAKAVLFNGLGHYRAAHAAAQRACQSEDFALLEGVLAELVEASVRSGSREGAVVALRRLEARALISRSDWALGVVAVARALLSDDDHAEVSYLEAIERLAGTRARVALGRARLLYGEWLRRQGRRVDARQQLTLAHRVFSEVGLGGFGERARRELLATGRTARKRTDDTRLDLTAQEAQIAQFAAGGWTNPEIGERLFISPRTVEWHLRKVFIKLGVSSRRQLKAIVLRAPHPAPSA
jgi:DNA-binding CsgD family transcriptional regulator